MLRAPILTVAGLVLASATGCTGSARPLPAAATPSDAATVARVDARGQLAVRAAAAKDRRYVATYRLVPPRGAARTITVVIATDGTWQVSLPASAMGGTVDVVIAGVRDGLYQCAVSGKASCVNVAPPGGHLPAAIDPRVQYLFTDWLDVLTDPDAALSVAETRLLAGAQGSCYSVEFNSASLAVPADPGVYCYLPDGTLTAASVGFGTVLLSGPVAAAPPTAGLPGPVRGGAPVPLVAPRQPTSTGGRA